MFTRAFLFILLIASAQFVLIFAKRNHERRLQKRIIDFLGIEEQNLVLALKYHKDFERQRMEASRLKKLVKLKHSQDNQMDSSLKPFFEKSLGDLFYHFTNSIG